MRFSSMKPGDWFLAAIVFLILASTLLHCLTPARHDVGPGELERDERIAYLDVG